MNSSNGEIFVALLCLAFCVFYGVSAGSIELFAGAQEELVTSRTFPYILTFFGAACSLSILYSALRSRSDSKSQETARSYRWGSCAGVIGLALVYSFLLTRIGFLLSTAGFLAAGILFLGERRWRFVIPAAFVPPLVFWLLLELGLDIKLPSLGLWG
ncbi:MAG: tripartite tricarboxylate transporter TctB family protein [Xanthomonadales bacterium]|nr:tripartite tricarboxylate transporter TctB family protein [Xanthomonadales bacterium]